jgi:ADP-ribose pyrophosphatase YjhB (NUDIX family)
VGVLAVVWRDGKVLLARRKNAPQAGCWGFPGGGVEPGETLEKAAQREVMEETGVRAHAVHALPPVEQIVTPEQDQGEGPSHWILIPVACAYDTGEPQADDDVVEAGWFDPEALPQPACADLDRVVADTMPSVGGYGF